MGVEDPLKAQEELLSKVNDESYDSERQPATPLVVNVGYVVHDVMEINELSRYVDVSLPNHSLPPSLTHPAFIAPIDLLSTMAGRSPHLQYHLQ